MLLLLFCVVGLALMSKNLSEKKATQQAEQKLTDACNEFNTRDVTLYWIGDYPDELAGIKEKVIYPEYITEEYMPVASPETHMVVRDADGNIVKEYRPVEYTKYIYIIINGATLSEDEYNVIRDCIKDNGVRTVVLGRNAINSFRDHLLMPVMDYTENDSMSYSLEAGPASHLFSDDSPFGSGTRTIDFINYMLGDMLENGD